MVKKEAHIRVTCKMILKVEMLKITVLKKSLDNFRLSHLVGLPGSDFVCNLDMSWLG